MAGNNYEILIAKLDEFIRKYYKNRLIRGAIYTVGILVLAYLSASVLEYYGRLGKIGRGVIFYTWLGLTAYVLVRFIFIPLSKLYRIGKIISYEQASQIIGAHFTDVQDKLLNTLQLKHQADSTPGQSSLIEASINQKINELKPVPFQSAINFKNNYRYLKFALVPILLLVVVVFANFRILTEGANRIVNYTEYFEKQAPFDFLIQNRKLQAMQNEDFVVKLKMKGAELPAEVYLEIDGNKFKMEKDGKTDFSYTFKNLQKTTDFRFFADEFYSKEAELEVLPKPLISGFQVKLEYPGYLNKKAEFIENAGDLTIPAGTVVKWKFNTRNAELLNIRFKDTLLGVKPAADNRFELTRRFLKENYYMVKAANNVITSNDSVLYNINVIPDAYPSIKVEETKDSLSTKLVYFAGDASDDYGISRVTFNYIFLKTDDAQKKAKGMQTITLRTGGRQDQQFYHIWDLNELGIQASEEIEYYFEVFDNDGVNGSKSTKSMVKTFRAPTLQEVEADLAQSSQAIKDKMSQAIEQTKKIDKEIRDLQKKLVEKKNLTWEDKKQIQELLDKQKQLEKQLEDLKTENLEKNIKESEYKNLDPELLEKQKELDKLFEEVFSDEMKEMMKQLEQLMMQENKEQLKEELENMELNSKDVNKQLDRMKELYKQLEVEKKMNEALDKLEELADKQEKLAEETEKTPENSGEQKQEELKDKQEDLNKQFEDLQKEMDELEKMNEELEQPHDLGLENKEEQEKEIEKNMEDSKEDIEKKDNQGASKKQKKAAKDMKDLSKKMESKMQQEKEDQQVEDYNTLREILDNLIELSFEQEKVMEDLKSVTGYNPQLVALTQKQRKMKDDAKIIEDSLLSLSKRVMQMRTYINKEVGEMNGNMDKAIKALGTRQVPLGRSYQQYVMTNLNNLAVMLSEVLKNMQENMQSSAQGKGSESNNARKKKGKGQDAAKLRQMQEELNRQLKEMKEGKNKGKGENGEDGKNGKNGKNKGQGQGEGNGEGEHGLSSKEWAKLAAQQEAIRRYLSDLEKQLKQEGNQGKLGDLKKTQDMMEEVEKDLVNKRLTIETLKRQQEILTRMLEHERADKERETDNERKSNEGKELERKLPPSVEEYLKQKNREQELLQTIPPSLREYYKNKTREYFKIIGGQ